MIFADARAKKNAHIDGMILLSAKKSYSENYIPSLNTNSEVKRMHIKTINGNQYYYESYRENGKVVSKYIKPVERKHKKHRRG